MDEDGAVGLDDEQPGREREVGGEPPVIVDAAAGYDETHRDHPNDAWCEAGVGSVTPPTGVSGLRLWETPRMARDFTKVGVIGLGTMGAGIVEVFARNGIEVVAVEVSDEAVEKGKGFCSTRPTGPSRAAS